MANAAGKAWRCAVCGYIHRESEPPDWCPVCGATKSEFEPFAEAVTPPKPPQVERWRCLNCNHVHVGPEPPDECPVCAARQDRFEPLAEEGAAVGDSGRPAKVVVVGGGIAGVSAIESLRAASPDAQVTLISRETDLPYYRLNLTRYLAGEIDEDGLPIHPKSWYDEHNVELLLGVEVSALSLEDQVVELRDGEKLPFEKLILTVGAHAFIPPFPGGNRDGVTSLRTARDATRILEMARAGMACVCIGGGILGLETAGALARRGASVTLLEGHGWLMPRQLNQKAAELFSEYVAGLGIRLLTNARTAEIVGDEHVAGVLLEDGKTIPADFVVIATGIRPNSHLARRARLEVNKGVVVDNRLASSHPHVLAAGDVAEHRGILYGNWSASQYQGSIAGMNAVGLASEFGGIPRSNTLKVLGLDLLSIGQFEPEDASYRVIEDEKERAYQRFVFRDGCLVGAILLGDTSVAGFLRKGIESKADFSGMLERHPTSTVVAEYLAEMSS